MEARTVILVLVITSNRQWAGKIKAEVKCLIPAALFIIARTPAEVKERTRWVTPDLIILQQERRSGGSTEELSADHLPISPAIVAGSTIIASEFQAELLTLYQQNKPRREQQLLRSRKLLAQQKAISCSRKQVF